MWDTGPRNKPLDFGANSDHVTLGYMEAARRTILRYTRFIGEDRVITPQYWYVLPGVCLTVTILCDQRPWQTTECHSGFSDLSP